MCPLDSFCFSPIVHKKPQKKFTFPDLQPSLSLLHNLVSESVVLNSCPRLSLVAGLDLFLFSFVSSIRCHLPKQKPIYKNFHPSIRICFSFQHHQNLIRGVLLKTGITFRSELRLR